MSPPNTSSQDQALDSFSLCIHLGLVVFGIAAWLSGMAADDYKAQHHLGFTLHTWLGMGLSVFMALRLGTGIFGPHCGRFNEWLPFTRERLALVAEDLAGLLLLRLPHRPVHQGLAAVVEALGLMIFFLMAATGICLFFTVIPGQKARGLAHAIKEVHEVGAVLIPLFLACHGGAVLLHALGGRHLWRRIFFLPEVEEQKP